jgi:hypothetical protein
MVTDRILSRKEVLTALYNSNYEFQIRSELTLRILEDEFPFSESEVNKKIEKYTDWKKAKKAGTLTKNDKCPIGKMELDRLVALVTRQRDMIDKAREEVERKKKACKTIENEINTLSKIN